MAFKLVCVLPFIHQGLTLYFKGREVTDGTEFTFFKATRPEYFVQVEYDTVPPPPGRTWTQRNAAGNGAWQALATSQDGSIIVAGQNTANTLLSRSTDGGATWGTLSGSAHTFDAWSAAATSSDGSVIAAAGGLGGTDIAVSTNSGSTWAFHNLSGNTNNMGVVAMSGSGAKILAADNTDITPVAYLSTNSGASFAPAYTGPGGEANSNAVVAISRDGGTMVFGWYSNTSFDSDLLISTNNGVSWSTIAPSNQAVWSGVAISVDGSIISVVDLATPNIMFRSTDAGANWTQLATPVTLVLGTCSDNGMTLAATDAAGGSSLLYISEDGGATWDAQTPTPGPDTWLGTAVSGDASKIVAGNNFPGSIWTSP